ncbi:MAG: hypothetical protein JWO80_2423 [Bryobacterales bacterium]|nr:hypothetical protein [Bryobacterales bacterium]
MIGNTSSPFHLLLVGVLLAGSAVAADKTGPGVGQAVPPFAATDQTGKQQTLRSVLGPKGALLVFYRSADW